MWPGDFLGQVLVGLRWQASQGVRACTEMYRHLLPYTDTRMVIKLDFLHMRLGSRVTLMVIKLDFPTK